MGNEVGAAKVHNGDNCNFAKIPPSGRLAGIIRWGGKRGIRMRLPKSFPDGTTYVVEARGAMIRRYVVFPNGRKVNLSSPKTGAL
jgi:hypothetical protein